MSRERARGSGERRRRSDGELEGGHGDEELVPELGRALAMADLEDAIQKSPCETESMDI